MRIALVSPYSWTYPGGVTRHIESLAERFLATGHDVRVLAPYDPPDRLAVRLHRGAEPARREAPDHLISLGRTVGFPANGAVSNLTLSPRAVLALRDELRTGGYDVVHVHEPVAPALGWDTLSTSPAPVVGTFHCFSENVVTNNLANLAGARRQLNRLKGRIAVSEAAAWTARRFYGGHYRIIPNGVEVPGRIEPHVPSTDRLRIAFVGQAVERKGLPVLMRAFEALREHVPATLTIVGATEEEVEPLLLDARDVEVLGKVDDEAKHAALAAADVLCAPSLGGESFGMVLTEAFAAGTPVVASDIAGYRDVVRDGGNGVLVPRGDATELAEVLRDLWFEPERRACLARAAAADAPRYAWEKVADEVLEVYEQACAVGEPEGALRRAAVRTGVLPADLEPRAPARRLESLEPKPGRRRRALGIARRVSLAAAAAGGAWLAWHALEQIGVESVGRTLLHSELVWILVGLALMCGSMVLRAVSWRAILAAALPDTHVRYGDAMQGTFIGVLMSATLPARLGEPARAAVVARRLGARTRETLPVVLGTIVSQTLLNILALVILGAIMFSTVGLFTGKEKALALYAVAPVVLLLVVLAAPFVLRRGHRSRGWAGELVARARAAMGRVRSGLAVFLRPKLGAAAAGAQLAAWGVQWIACYALLVALGLDHLAGLGAAAAVLFAVNVTAVLPATPSNIGVFQAACVTVLTTGYGVSTVDALGYGIILQAVEIATAAVMGMPALVKEGLSWRDVRARALMGAPVVLDARRHSRRAEGLEAEA